ncbi:hypothetical protein PC121_g7489 [Phytophthora cactorum]|nr:hypothetical protein PC121_g7489 [Phytophthora cactorum]
MSLFALVGKQSTDLTATHKAAALLLHQNEYAVQRSALRRSFDLPRNDRAVKTITRCFCKSLNKDASKQSTPSRIHYLNDVRQPPPPRPDLHPLSR